MRSGEHTIDLERVAEILRGGDIPAVVAQTGGGVATLYAGDAHTGADGYPRYPAVVGPGWFDGPGWTRPRASTTELYVGPDDDGEAAPTVVGPGSDEPAVARLTARVVTDHERSSGP